MKINIEKRGNAFSMFIGDDSNMRLSFDSYEITDSYVELFNCDISVFVIFDDREIGKFRNELSREMKKNEKM